MVKSDWVIVYSLAILLLVFSLGSTTHTWLPQDVKSSKDLVSEMNRVVDFNVSQVVCKQQHTASGKKNLIVVCAYNLFILGAFTTKLGMLMYYDKFH